MPKCCLNKTRGGGYCTDLPAAGVIPLHKLATSQCCLAVNTPSRAESVSLWEEGGRIPPAWTRTWVSIKSRGGTGQLGHPSWLSKQDYTL
ncbi:hypothetical protein HanPI659440_Chr03g0122011 [Helianthus annuus]|nr:hypothetical protein HanPI659440_Chr03g0122011 [Helianthus annuus]